MLTTSHKYKTNYTAHTHDMVHVPAKLKKYNNAFFSSVRKLSVTDIQTDGRGRFNISAWREIIKPDIRDVLLLITRIY